MRKAEIKAQKKVSLEELKRMIKKEKDVRVYQRLLAIRMSYLGHSVTQIALILSVEESTIYDWIGTKMDMKDLSQCSCKALKIIG